MARPWAEPSRPRARTMKRTTYINFFKIPQTSNDAKHNGKHDLYLTTPAKHVSIRSKVLGGYELSILLLRGIERVQGVERNDNSNGPVYTDYSIDLEQSQVSCPSTTGCAASLIYQAP